MFRPAAQVLMNILCAARLARPDLLKAVCALASNVNTWTPWARISSTLWCDTHLNTHACGSLVGAAMPLCFAQQGLRWRGLRAGL